MLDGDQLFDWLHELLRRGQQAFSVLKDAVDLEMGPRLMALAPALLEENSDGDLPRALHRAG